MDNTEHDFAFLLAHSASLFPARLVNPVMRIIHTQSAEKYQNHLGRQGRPHVLTLVFV